MSSKKQRVKVSELLPDDNQLLETNLRWRKFFEKYSAKKRNSEKGALSPKDALSVYAASEELGTDPSGSEAEDCGDVDSDSAYDMDDVKMQKKLVTKERRDAWNVNGLDEILNDVHFKLSLRHVDNWLKDYVPGCNKQVANDREMRITTIDGDTTVNMSLKSNMSIANASNEQSLISSNTKNYEIKAGENKKVIIQQIEKTTLTTIFSDDLTRDHRFRLRNLNGFNLQGLTSSKSLDGFKVPYTPLMQLQRSICDSESMPKQAITDSAWNKGSSKSVVKMDGKKNVKVNSNVSRRGINKNKQKIKKPKSNSSDAKTKRNGCVTERSHVCADRDNVETGHRFGQNRTQKKGKKKTVRFISSSSSSDEEEESSQNQRKPTNESGERKSIASNQNVKIAEYGETTARMGTDKEIVDYVCISSSSNSDESFTIVDERDTKQDNAAATSTTTTTTTTSSSVPSQPFHVPPAGDKWLDEKPDTSVQPKKYLMPQERRQFLKRYNIEGIVIYEPKTILVELPPGVDKELITKKDLNLSAIPCEKRRKKFEGYRARIHPNSTLVYYMSDTDEKEETPKRANDEDKENADHHGSSSDDEDDDPLVSYRPYLVVLEFPHGSGSTDS